MMKRIMQHTGFTLVEALLSMSILAFVMMCAYGVLKTGNTLMTNDNALVDMQQQARNAMDRISREVRQSSSRTVTVINANSDRITFTTPTAVNIMYYLTGTTLVREYPANTRTNVASNIARLKFTVSGSTLLIDVRADKTLFAKTVSFPLVQKIRVRN
jgi:type II secretory pathway component PulJ